jgi:hypothetical protein
VRQLANASAAIAIIISFVMAVLPLVLGFWTSRWLTNLDSGQSRRAVLLTLPPDAPAKARALRRWALRVSTVMRG